MKMRNVFAYLSGGAWFVGSYIVELLLDEGFL
jgi:hypothetical protein